jgi:hypothetical protein
LKGSLVAFAERFTRGSGYHTGWIWVQGVPRQIHLRDDDGFNITDAAGLPDGGLLILERYFRWTSGVKMRIRRLSAADIKPGAKLVGRTLVEADSGFEIDNMEGIAVHRGATGETVVTLISDDNFNRLPGAERRDRSQRVRTRHDRLSIQLYLRHSHGRRFRPDQSDGVGVVRYTPR